jgi:hypothetical protein
MAEPSALSATSQNAGLHQVWSTSPLVGWTPTKGWRPCRRTSRTFFKRDALFASGRSRHRRLGGRLDSSSPRRRAVGCAGPRSTEINDGLTTVPRAENVHLLQRHGRLEVEEESRGPQHRVTAQLPRQHLPAQFKHRWKSRTNQANYTNQEHGCRAGYFRIARTIRTHRQRTMAKCCSAMSSSTLVRPASGSIRTSAKPA